MIVKSDKEFNPPTGDHAISFLIISDDEDDVKTITDEFKRNKIVNPLFVEYNSPEALEVVREKSCEGATTAWIILLEVNVEQIDGFKILKSIHEATDLNCVKVFVITSNPEVKALIEKMKYQVAGYIPKPVSFDKLAASVSILKYKWELTDNTN